MFGKAVKPRVHEFRANVQQFCSEKLEIRDVEVKFASKLFERRGKSTVIADFGSDEAALKILKNSHKLAGTSILIEKKR